MRRLLHKHYSAHCKAAQTSTNMEHPRSAYMSEQQVLHTAEVRRCRSTRHAQLVTTNRM